MAEFLNCIPDDVKPPTPKLTPLEYFLLHALYFKSKYEDDLIKSAQSKFGINENTVKKTLDDSLINHHKYLIKTKYSNDTNPSDTKSFVSISKSGFKSINTGLHLFPGIDDKLYRYAIAKIADDNFQDDSHYVVNFESKNDTNPNLIIYCFKSKSGKAFLGVYDQVDPDYWSSDVVVIDIHMEPTKYRDSVYRNYKQNVSRGMVVHFIVFNESDADCISEIMLGHNVCKHSYVIREKFINTLDIPQDW